MSRNIFIAGTGTDVGKTFVTALIVKKIKEAGKSAAYFKAAMSGNIRRGDGTLIPGDARFVKDISGICEDLDDMCPYVYENAVSPHLASRLEGNSVKMNVVKNAFEKVTEEYEYVTVEGSGGILCPISFDEEKIMLEDVIKTLGLSCIIVADAGLGTINSVGLTVSYMRSKNIGIKGIIFNRFHKGDIMEEDNLKMCEYLTGVKVIATVGENDKDIDIDKDFLLSLYE